MRGRWATAVVTAAAVLVAGCTSGGRGRPAETPARTRAPASATEPVVIASFNFTESALLAEIYAQSLEHAGIAVRRELDLGPRELVRPALQRGVVDLVPEYLGTALTDVDPHAVVEHRTVSVVREELQRALAPWHIDVLTPSAAQDQNGFAVTAQTARKYHLRTLSDLAAVAPRLVLGGATECPRRPLCLPGLRRVYGIVFGGFRAFDDERQRAVALEEGVVDVEVTFTTDPRTADGSLVLLRDDRSLQPVESVVPVVSDRMYQRHGLRLVQALDAVSAALDSRSLTFLDWRVNTAGKDVRSEARGWLKRHGLLG